MRTGKKWALFSHAPPEMSKHLFLSSLRRELGRRPLTDSLQAASIVL